ncbi:phosphonate ABC transporter ATP-binding protein [Georgenia alba]|uniref:Phosphonate ABC transporter ATP-binding protein n=1 Tax=Georgenia alba TaxID=2233858 RepID=A0ABW2QDR8_9MICO
MTDTSPTRVRLADVTKSFGAGPVLDRVGLDAAQGEFVALVGPSGAGKSTLLRLLNGMHAPDSGTVEVLGTDPAACSRRALRTLRRDVGFVFQDFGLVGRLTALENVLMGALATLRLPRYGVMTYPASLRARAVENLERVGLVEHRFQRCDTLSGGQQQRVAIARTLMQDPRVILADEPVASLDPATSVAVLDVLGRIAKEDGRTVLCSLHQVDLALQVADRVVALRGGHKVLDRPAGELDEAAMRAVYAAEAGHG